MTALLAAAGVFSGLQVRGDDADWSVSQSGLPGIFSWQNLYNWTLPGVNLTPPSAPDLTVQQANLNLINIRGDQTINLDGLVTLGTLNIGDTSGSGTGIIKEGDGMLILRGSNTYTGANILADFGNQIL